MRHRTPLPAALPVAFTLAKAAEVGVGRGRASSTDLVRPFHGIRSQTAPGSPLERVRALVPRLTRDQAIGGETALRVWGYPVRGHWRMSDEIEVVVPTGCARVRTAGVLGRRLARERGRVSYVDGIPLLDPVAALFMHSSQLAHEALVVLLDAFITRADNYPGLHRERPTITVAEIEARMQEWGRFPGCGRVRAALVSVRDGVESPKETETRLLIVALGLPEPVVQHEIRRCGRVVARTDLAYPELRIGIEYEGDGHRTDRDQWRRDIQRQSELESLGWMLIRVTQLDLADGGRSMGERIRKAIGARR